MTKMCQLSVGAQRGLGARKIEIRVGTQGLRLHSDTPRCGVCFAAAACSVGRSAASHHRGHHLRDVEGLLVALLLPDTPCERACPFAGKSCPKNDVGMRFNGCMRVATHAEWWGGYIIEWRFRSSLVARVCGHVCEGAMWRRYLLLSWL